MIAIVAIRLTYLMLTGVLSWLVLLARSRTPGSAPSALAQSTPAGTRSSPPTRHREILRLQATSAELDEGQNQVERPSGCASGGAALGWWAESVFCVDRWTPEEEKSARRGGDDLRAAGVPDREVGPPALAQWRRRARGSKPRAAIMPTPGGWNRFSIEVDDLTAVVDTLRKAGVRLRSDVVSGVGDKQVLIDDSSGKPIELFEPTRDEARLGDQ